MLIISNDDIDYFDKHTSYFGSLIEAEVLDLNKRKNCKINHKIIDAINYN